MVWDTDLDSFRLPTFAESESIADRINGYIASNNYPGVYYLGSSAPSDGDTWKVAQSSVFSDTINTGTVTNYNIYVKSDMASPPSADTYNRPLFIWKGNTELYVNDVTDVRNHAQNEVIAMETTTGVRYSAIYPSTAIFEKDTSGIVTQLDTTDANLPERGAISVTAGKSYYGGKPIEFHKNGNGHLMVPWSLRGREFGGFSNRYGDSTYYLFAKQACTVKFFVDETNGINGTATRTVSLSANTVHTETFTGIDNQWVFITSTQDIIVSAEEAQGDKLRIPPAKQTVYRPYNSYERTTVNTAPSTQTSNRITDTTHNVVAFRSGDGAGSDASQGLGEEFLSNTFSWGDALKDYNLVARDDDTMVTVSYWNATDSEWVVQEYHAMDADNHHARNGNDGTCWCIRRSRRCKHRVAVCKWC